MATKQQIKNRIAQVRHALEPLQNQEEIKNTIQYCLIELDDVLHEIAESVFTSAIDLTGKTFGQLTVIGRGSKMKWNNACGYIYNWMCRCSCGNVSEYKKSTLLQHKGEIPLMCHKCHAKLLNITHGQSKTRLYAAWIRMRQSCYDPNFPQYKYCGGRGVKVCDEWMADYETFADWAMSHGYNDNYYLCRKDSYQGFNPENCYWALHYNTKMITINGETHSITDWCRLKGIKYATLKYRLKRGWPEEKLFSELQRN